MNRYIVGEKEIPFNKIFLLSDLHFGIRSNSTEWLDNFKDFFQRFYIPWVKENVENGDILFVLGDWFDNRQLLDILVMNISIDIVGELSKILPVYFITGNHDIYKKKDTDVHSLRAFKFINNVEIFEKPIIIKNNNASILLLPWIGDRKEEEEYAKKNVNRADYIFAHTNLSGFKYDNGKEIFKGSDLVSFNYKRVISGHIHKRQLDNNKGIYIGSPYHTKRSDIGNQKGVYIFYPKDNKLKFKENNYSPIYQKIPLTTILDKTLKECYDIFSNNYSDIIIPDEFIHLFSLPKFIDLLKDCPYKKIEAVGERQKIDDDESIIINGESTKDILTLIEETIDEVDQTKYNLDYRNCKSKLKKLNKEYYKKVQEENN
ncbi:MAG: metallophosphoesterase [bacterium]